MYNQYHTLTLTEFISKAQHIHSNAFDYSHITNWINTKHKITIKCNTCNKLLSMRANHHTSTRNPQTCKYCNKKISDVNLTKPHDTYLIEFSNRWGDEYLLLDNYVHSAKHISIKCNACDTVITKRPDHALHGKYLCPCKIPLRLSEENFIKKSDKKHNNRYEYTNVKYTGYRNPVTIICKKHGPFSITPEVHLMGIGCKKCSESSGETKIECELMLHHIAFVRQKRFSDCKYKKPLPFDFYIPDRNICIEYNGEQHYKPTRFRGMSHQKSIDAFTLQQLKDSIKSDYCKQKNMELITIPYWDKSNISDIISALT